MVQDPCAATALKELLTLVGLPTALAGHADLRGADPILPTPYRVAAASAASLAAIGIAASEIWRRRSGRGQTLRIDLPAAAIALRSNKYLSVDGAKPEWEWEPISGFYPTGDGRRIFLHTNFPNLRDATLRVLGVPADREAVAAECARGSGEDLETAIHDGGGCASFVRTPEEWRAHPHREAIADVPVVNVERIGDADPVPLAAAARPLAGVRVLDLTRVIAGPTASRVLAEHGADVLKITRADLPRSGMLDMDTGIGKLAAELDLRVPEQAARMAELVRSADIFVQSYRPGTLEARGLGEDELSRARPGIIHVSLSAWGHVGPWRMRRGYDTVVQAATGMAAISAGPTAPAFMPVSAIDYISGYLMALGAMVALLRRAEEGGSWRVRVGLAPTGRWITDRGLLDVGSIADVADEISKPDLAAMMVGMDSPYGRLHYLRPPLGMSETPALASRPPVPFGTHPAEWP